ncbi:MAG: UvrD-helicase domain-containing protein, partial [Chloroflexota bacterium]
MSQNRQEQTLRLHPLNEKQNQAVTTEGVDLMITAGAGSGKTRTLVARYLYLIAGGASPRNVAAVTFTEKAAREMRNRIRGDIETLKGQNPEDQAYWDELSASIDGARIGTIHGLCAEILRSHPAEAKLDPEFGIVDETNAALFQINAIEQTLVWGVNQADIIPLFENYDTRVIIKLIKMLFNNRLNLSKETITHKELLLKILEEQLNNQVFMKSMQELIEFSQGSDFVE